MGEADSFCNLTTGTLGKNNVSSYTYSGNNASTIENIQKVSNDVGTFTEFMNNGNNSEALEVYIGSASANLQSTISLTSVASELESADSLFQTYTTLFGSNFLDQYTKDAINCNGTFLNKNAELCKI